MALSCECQDFDKYEHESWWEAGRAGLPPEGECCVECGKKLDPTVKCATFLHWEVFTPEGPEPPDFEYDGEIDGIPQQTSYPWSTNGMSKAQLEEIRICRALWDERFGIIEQWYIHQREEWERIHGFDDEGRRCERVVARDYRCERCGDLADSIEELGYCTIHMGQLIEAHMEFIEEHGLAPMVWRKDRDGVLNPVRLTRMEIMRRDVMDAYRRAIFNLRYEMKKAWWRSSYRFSNNARIKAAYGRYKDWLKKRKEKNGNGAS